jgi:hypothetical protein
MDVEGTPIPTIPQSFLGLLFDRFRFHWSEHVVGRRSLGTGLDAGDVGSSPAPRGARNAGLRFPAPLELLLAAVRLRALALALGPVVGLSAQDAPFSDDRTYQRLTAPVGLFGFLGCGLAALGRGLGGRRLARRLQRHHRRDEPPRSVLIRFDDRYAGRPSSDGARTALRLGDALPFAKSRMGCLRARVDEDRRNKGYQRVYQRRSGPP